MAEQDGQEKTEQASGKRLEDSREKGQVAKSPEINSFAIFTAGISLIYLAKTMIASNVRELAITIFGSLHTLEISVPLLKVYSVGAFSFFVTVLSPIFLGLVLISLAAGYGQVGFKLTPQAIAPKFNKLNPLSGIKRILFSPTSLIEVAKSITKLLIVGSFSYWMISDAIVHSLELVRFSIEEILGFMISTAFSFVWRVSMLYAVLAISDFLYQRHKHKKDLMMTKQETKEEGKQMEGDPQVKARIRGKMISLSRQRMMKDVPKADVIITNPTHYAIALKYDSGKKAAPVVLAKGMDLIAQRIKKIAAENDVPIHEDVQLARALYKVCEVGEQIPTSFFRAVAQILAHIFQAKYEKKKRSII